MLTVAKLKIPPVSEHLPRGGPLRWLKHRQ